MFKVIETTLWIAILVLVFYTVASKAVTPECEEATNLATFKHLEFMEGKITYKEAIKYTEKMRKVRKD